MERLVEVIKVIANKYIKKIGWTGWKSQEPQS